MRVLRLEHKDTHIGPFRQDGQFDGKDYSEFFNRYYHGGAAWGAPNIEDFPTPGYELNTLRETGQLDQVDRFLRVAGEQSTPNTLFGAQDDDQFSHWFDQDQLRLVAKYGFVKVIYEVPDDAVAPLTKQVAFSRSAARLVETVPLEP